MKKILLLAHFVSPTKGSEFSVAWNYITNMSIDNEITVIYGSSSGIFEDTSELDEYLENNTIPNVKFIPVKCNQNRYTKLLFYVYHRKSILFNISWNLIYKQWHKTAYIKSKEIIENIDIDVVHYLTPIGFKEPGFLWKLNKPYIWGPVKGISNRPFKLFKVLTFKQKVISIFRNIILNVILRYSKRIMYAIKRSDVIIVATSSTKTQFQNIFKKSYEYLPENGIVKLHQLQSTNNDLKLPLKLIWIGRIDFNKALIILLEALTRIKDLPWELHVLGDGDEKENLVSYSKNNNLDSKIIWHGNVPRNKVQDLLRSSHLHVITSLSEANTTVIWEAMSNGVPTITLDHCGMHDTICDKCGIKIPIVSYSQVISDFSGNIEQLINSPKKINEMSEATIKCAKNFTWDYRRHFFNKQYKLAEDIYNKRIQTK